MSMIVLLFFPLIMAFAALSDMMTMRISNRLTLGLAAGFVIAALVVNMPVQDLAWHLAMGLVVLVAAFTFFAFGWIGGGDAKFAAAAALWLGMPHTLVFVVYAGLFGGALTLALLTARRFPLPQPLAAVDWIDRLHDQRTGIPYGIALAVAGLVTFPDTAIFASLLG